MMHDAVTRYPCVCVCERERERGRQARESRERHGERERERERVSHHTMMHDAVCVKEREIVCERE